MKAIVSTLKTQWKPFLGNELPQSAIDFCNEGEVFKYPGCWLIGCIFYKGDVETTKDWIICTDNGDFTR